MSTVLHAQGIRVVCHGAGGSVLAADAVDLTVDAGELVGIIGESGSGKTTLVRSIIGLLGRNCAVVEGTIKFRGRTVFGDGKDDLRTIRGRDVGMIFQNATGSLNPLLKIGTQLREVLRVHTSLGPAELDRRAQNLLTELGLDDADRVLDSYPHQLSGGMCQRAAIAIAVAAEPALVIADECTSALDVTTQADVIGLLRRVTRDKGWCLLFVTHDILLAAELCTRLVVMYGGHVVEDGPVEQVVRAPRHPYTQALLAAVPLWRPRSQLAGIPGTPGRVRPDHVGCRFADRCSKAEDICSKDDVKWSQENDRGYRCLFPVGGGGGPESGPR